jgi:endonuclease YncB( thermonuclease family)
MQIDRPKGTHRARIVRFADADTAVLLIEGQWGIWVEKYVRLIGIESFELDGAHAETARGIRQLLNRDLAGDDCLIHLTSRGHDRYGRLRGRITLGDSDLAEWLCKKGYAWPCTAEESARQHADADIARHNRGGPECEHVPPSPLPPSAPAATPAGTPAPLS